MCVDVLKLSDWVIRDIGFSSRLVSVKMNLDSEKITNPCINRLLLNAKGIFVILKDRDIPTTCGSFHYCITVWRVTVLTVLGDSFHPTGWEFSMWWVVGESSHSLGWRFPLEYVGVITSVLQYVWRVELLTVMGETYFQGWA